MLSYFCTLLSVLTVHPSMLLVRLQQGYVTFSTLSAYGW